MQFSTIELHLIKTIVKNTGSELKDLEREILLQKIHAMIALSPPLTSEFLNDVFGEDKS